MNGKYRIYDTKEQYWLDPKHFYITGEGRPFSCQSSQCCITNTYRLLGSERFVIGQSIGLKDKSGKEIYESDKVRGQGQWGSTTSSKVVLDYDGAQVEIGDNWIRLSQFTELEIIGNIHDDLKLLEAKE